MELKQGFEWCRKGKYNVKIELGCNEIPILVLDLAHIINKSSNFKGPTPFQI